ncbi:hypothetical protein Fmac_025550 [Flemingia macrophylla]|uniref:Uncharacterized protein n=1 Tax=Flemingia macrophylla TaxID=520843 RepID=A0ABD1LSJ8_9FABA
MKGGSGRSSESRNGAACVAEERNVLDCPCYTYGRKSLSLPRTPHFLFTLVIVFNVE